MKYVMLRLSDGDRPILFPSLMRHSNMVPSGLRHNVVSAGHFELIEAHEEPDFGWCASSPAHPGMKLHAYGDSPSLASTARPQDAGIILSSLTRQ